MSAPMSYWSISSQVLKTEAEELGLQVEILIPEKNLFLVKSQNKEILFKSTDFGGNSSLAEKIANDKELAYMVLKKYGLPIPETIYIHGYEFDNFDWSSLSALHFPVIVKPIDGAHGNGVCMNIISISELQEKLKASFLTYSKMIIQEQIIGDECRVLVVLGEVILAYNRIPPSVIGNGQSTIKQLIDYENLNNPLRQESYHAPLSLIRIDDELTGFIAKKGFTLNHVLPNGFALELRGNSNMGTGGTARDVTHLIHKDIKNLCVDISNRLGFSICGVDIMTIDFTRPLEEVGGVILELNATPGIGGDKELTSINTGSMILKKLFGLK